MDPNWHDSSEDWAGNGISLMIPPPGNQHTVIYGGGLFGDMDGCVDVTLPSGDLNPVALGMIQDSARLAFWVTKFSDDYEFLISPIGTCAIIRNGFTPTITNWTGSSAIKPGLNQVKTLRVETKGDQATFYVKRYSFNVDNRSVAAGWRQNRTGGASGPNAQSFWHFSNLKVTN
jgi:hypothetical protein